MAMAYYFGIAFFVVSTGFERNTSLLGNFSHSVIKYFQL